MRWCLTALKTRFQRRILNVPLGLYYIGVWALIYPLHNRCEKFLLGWQGDLHGQLNLKKNNCFEEMLYRKIDFTFCGVTLFKRALKCITLKKMKKA